MGQGSADPADPADSLHAATLVFREREFNGIDTGSSAPTGPSPVEQSQACSIYYCRCSRSALTSSMDTTL